MDHGIKITLKDKKDFLKIVETLTRIGICSKDNVITQTCHILHKKGEYYILHFKELLQMDGVSKTSIDEEDLLRRNGIVKLLNDWKLCEIEFPIENYSISKLKIVSYKEKSKYNFKQNYTIGKIKKDSNSL